jgi:cell division protein FtsN
MTTDIERGGIDVSNAHEPSYYEIALTNRQVVVAFVILLTCLIAAFFSGIWIGRESALRAQDQALRKQPAPAGRQAAAGADGQALQEFKFFSETRKKPAKKAAAAAETAPGRPEPRDQPPAAGAVPAPPPPSRQARLAEEHGGEGEPLPGEAANRPAPPPSPLDPAEARGPGAPAAKGAAAAPGKKVSPGAAEKGAAARGQRAGAERRPAADDSGAAPAETVHPRSLPEAAAPAAGGVVIQVFSSADKEQADRLRERLVKAGQSAFLSPTDKGGQTMYRVRVGPFASREQAELVAEKLRKEQKLDTWITPK